MAEEKPLTCEDVRRLIKENGGTAKGLDLSEQTFVEAIDLSDLDLHGIILKDARFPFRFLQVMLPSLEGAKETNLGLR